MRVLWIAPYFFLPPRAGGHLRVMNLVRQVIEAGHEVEYWHLGEPSQLWPRDEWPRLAVRAYPPSTPARGRVGRLLQVNPECAQLADIEAIVRDLTSANLDQYSALVIEHSWLASLITPDVDLPPTIVTAQAIEHHVARQRCATAPLTHKPYWYADYLKLRHLERRAFRSDVTSVAVSTEDRDSIRRLSSRSRVEVIPNGIDIHRYRPTDSRPAGETLLFVAGFDYFPNQDAARWIHDEILPTVRRSRPSAEAHLVGRQPPPWLVNLHNPDAGFHVIGEVEDVRPYLESDAVYIVPLRSGSGTRLKILEALACGIPVVSTALGAEGLDLIPGTHYLRAETTSEFAVGIDTILRDVAESQSLARNGRSHVEERFDWDELGADFLKVLGDC